MKKDEGFNSDRSIYCGYYDSDSGDSIYFSDGKLESELDSNVASSKTIMLSKNQTLDIYKAMKKYFESKITYNI